MQSKRAAEVVEWYSDRSTPEEYPYGEGRLYGAFRVETVEPGASLPRTRKPDDQAIFYELVQLQDEISIWDPEYQEKNVEAKRRIASKYGLTSDQLNNIIHRGAEEQWDMPPPP